MEQRISIDRLEQAVNLFGSFDENIRLIEQELGVRVVGRDDQLKISGEDTPVAYAAKVIQGLIGLSALFAALCVVAGFLLGRFLA